MRNHSPAAATPYVDSQGRACAAVEPGGEDQHVEVVSRAAGKPDPFGDDLRDGVFVDIY